MFNKRVLKKAVDELNKAKKPAKPKTNAPNMDENPFDFLERQIEEMIKKAIEESAVKNSKP